MMMMRMMAIALAILVGSFTAFNLASMLGEIVSRLQGLATYL